MRHGNCTRPLSNLEEISSDVERIFDSLVGRTVGSVLRGTQLPHNYSPSLDVVETANEFLVTVDLPGVKPEDVKVEIEDGKLAVSGSRSTFVEANTKQVHRVERSKGTFHRVVGLPKEIDSERIDAHYENGVLHIILPKSAVKQPRMIEIRTGS